MLFFKGKSHYGRALLNWEANRKCHKYYLFLQEWQNNILFNPLCTGRLFHCHMLDGVGCTLLLSFYF